MDKIKIAVPICNRTNYTKLKKILGILNANQSIDVGAIVSSSLLISRKTSGIQDIIDDGVKIVREIDVLMMNDSLEAMSKTSGMSLIEHATFLHDFKPDMVLIVGDRFDMMPAALAAKMCGIPIYHIQGGERSGSIDDTVRDIISICADRHYVATEKAREYVERITFSENVFNFGCPSVEMLHDYDVGDFLDVKTFKKRYRNSFGIAPNENYILVAAHPNTDDEYDMDMGALLGAVLSFGLKTVVMRPNIDAYNQHIADAIREFKNDVVVVRHMPVEDFVKLMAHASCMVGNSSSGIREASSFGTPVVNVGNRQAFRERNINVTDVPCTYEEVHKGIGLALASERTKSNLYYQKDCASNVCRDIIASLTL